MIIVNETDSLFYLETNKTSLILQAQSTGHITLNYFGEKIKRENLSFVIDEIPRASYLSDTDLIIDFKLEQWPQLFPAYGNTDLRRPAFEFEYEDGSRITDLRYRTFHIQQGKPTLNGLPHLRGNPNVETITFYLFDEIKMIEVAIHISVFVEEDAFSQSVTVNNLSTEDVQINRLMSCNLDFLENNFEYITLSGAWGRENHIKRSQVVQGFQGVESLRGASGHGQNPFGILAKPNVTEDYGEAFALSLIYSGNFLLNIEEDMHQNTRFQIGLSPFDFSWTMKPKEIFQSPEAIIVYSKQGLGEITRKFHQLFRNHLLSQVFSKKERPVLLNNWEATYFDFDRRTLLELAHSAVNVGIELFVLDDGWFGNRTSADSSLGDWQPNEKKLGGTLASLANEVNQVGLQFGLWIEPEMVSRKSQLFREHPEWIIQCNQRIIQESRKQYVLDLANPLVCDYLLATLKKLLNSANITYVKWDMNRNFTNLGSLYLQQNQQKEQAHRYILGLYRLLEELTQTFPDVLFESCAGGGGRFDAGMLYYMPQTWTSDDTDAIERLKIQQGTSLVYPAITMGCHVSDVPNHQVGRITPLKTRGVVAMMGNLGYELDLLKMEKNELKDICEQVKMYKAIRKTVQFGDFYRLTELEEDNQYAWQIISEDKSKLIVSYVQVLAHANTVSKRLKLKKLEKDSYYIEQETGSVYSSEILMNIGIQLPKVKSDYFSSQWFFHKIPR